MSTDKTAVNGVSANKIANKFKKIQKMLNSNNVLSATSGNDITIFDSSTKTFEDISKNLSLNDMNADTISAVMDLIDTNSDGEFDDDDISAVLNTLNELGITSEDGAEFTVEQLTGLISNDKGAQTLANNITSSKESGQVAKTKKTNKTKKSPAQKNINKFLKKAVNGAKLSEIPDNQPSNTAYISISKEEFENYTGKEYSAAWASEGTVDIAKSILGTDEIKDADGNTISSREDLVKYNKNIPDDPTTIPIGSIVITNDADENNFHSGVLLGYTKDGRAIVAEANSAKSPNENGVAVVVYDYNTSEKSIRGYIPLETPEGFYDIPKKAQKSETEVNTSDTKDSVTVNNQVLELFGVNQDSLNTENFGNGRRIESSSITKGELAEKLGKSAPYTGAYAASATLDIAKYMHSDNPEVLSYLDRFTNTVSTPELSQYANLTINGDRGEIGDIVILNDPNGGNLHCGVITGFTENNEPIVAEANSAKSDDGSGAILAVYNYDSTTEKSIKGVMHLNNVTQVQQSISYSKAGFNWEACSYDASISNKLAQNGHNTLYQYSNNECMRGVCKTLQETFGCSLQNLIAASSAAEALRGNIPGYEEIASHFVEVTDYTGNLADLPAGAIVVWSNGGSASDGISTEYGHISISLGDGRESSDCVREQIQSPRAYTIFVPVA